MKSSKEYNSRRNEILDQAGRLFASKGYEKCTVQDILRAVGIAKGTFYYYFRSKEEVLDAIVERVTETVVERAMAVAEKPELHPVEKLLYTILSMRVESEVTPELMEKMHNPQNALMHQKSLQSMVTNMAPILAKIVEEGIGQGVFESEFPEPYMKIFLTASITLMDDGIFQVEPEEKQVTFQALVALLEKMLGAQAGFFWNQAKQHWG